MSSQQININELDISTLSDDLMIYPTFAYRNIIWKLKNVKGILEIPLDNSTIGHTIKLWLVKDGNILHLDNRYENLNWKTNDVTVYDNKNNTYIGRIIEISDHWIDISNNDKIQRIKDYSKIESIYSEPHLEIAIPENWENSELHYSYIRNKINWLMYYVIIFNEDPNIISSLELWANINNGADIYKTNVSLVYSNALSPEQKLLEQETSILDPPIEKKEDKISTYTYDLGSMELYTENNINIFSFKNIKATKTYFHQVSSFSTYYGYVINADEKIHEKFKPSGQTIFYQQIKQKENYLGKGDIGESRPGDPFEIIIGKTDQIQCLSTFDKKLIGINENEIIPPENYNIISEKQQINSISTGNIIHNESEFMENNMLINETFPEQISKNIGYLGSPRGVKMDIDDAINQELVGGKYLMTISTKIWNKGDTDAEVIISNYIADIKVENICPEPTALRHGNIDWKILVPPTPEDSPYIHDIEIIHTYCPL